MRFGDLRLVHIPKDHWRWLLGALRERKARVVVGETHFSSTWRVTLVVVDGVVQGVALVRRFGRPGTFQDGLDLKEFRQFGSSPAWDAVLQRMPPRLRECTRREDGEKIPPKTATALGEALQQVSPGSGDMIDDLRLLLTPEVLAGSAVLAVKEQRDALALGLEIAGLDSRNLLPQSAPDLTAPFLMGLTRQRVSEATMIRHDASVFDGWLEASSETMDVAQFVDPLDPERRVTVIYADKEQLEHLTGTDLIYYREHRPGFILVQYKRMRRTGPRRSTAVYYPDEQLKLEIARFEKLPAPAQPSSAQEWRLCDDSFFVKLIDENVSKPEENRLVQGHYLPITLARLLLADAESGVRPAGWSAEGLREYLSNDEFLMLAKQGYIGTRGRTTEALQAIVTDALQGGRGVLVTIDHADPNVAGRLRHG